MQVRFVANVILAAEQPVEPVLADLGMLQAAGSVDTHVFTIDKQWRRLQISFDGEFTDLTALHEALTPLDTHAQMSGHAYLFVTSGKTKAFRHDYGTRWRVSMTPPLADLSPFARALRIMRHLEEHGSLLLGDTAPEGFAGREITLAKNKHGQPVIAVGVPVTRVRDGVKTEETQLLPLGEEFTDVVTTLNKVVSDMDMVGLVFQAANQRDDRQLKAAAVPLPQPEPDGHSGVGPRQIGNRPLFSRMRS